MAKAKLRFYLNTPLAIDGHHPPRPLMLDGILGYAWAIRNGYTKTPAEIKPENLVFPELPLELIGDKCYAASAAFLPKEAHIRPTFIIGMPDWKMPMAKHSPGMTYATDAKWPAGKQEVYWELFTPYVDFYFDGNIEEIVELLKIIWAGRHLGSKRGSGYGLIRKIELIEKAEDWSVQRDGLPTRYIPIEIANKIEGLKTEGLKPEWETYYPPYWATANSCWCYVPPAEQWLPHKTANEIEAAVENFLERKMSAMERRLKEGSDN